jgi:3-hydroxyacyl-[acyl-carrier-protein] dehydratase
LLLNDLYTIQSLAESDNRMMVLVRLFPDHAIFKGHFPGQPVLPGACMMEMITEITGECLHQSFRISGGPMIKFLHMIDPQKDPLINLEINYQLTHEKIVTDGKIFKGSIIFMKFQLVFIPNPIQ